MDGWNSKCWVTWSYDKTCDPDYPFSEDCPKFKVDIPDWSPEFYTSIVRGGSITYWANDMSCPSCINWTIDHGSDLGKGVLSQQQKVAENDRDARMLLHLGIIDPREESVRQEKIRRHIAEKGRARKPHYLQRRATWRQSPSKIPELVETKRKDALPAQERETIDSLIDLRAGSAAKSADYPDYVPEPVLSTPRHQLSLHFVAQGQPLAALGEDGSGSHLLHDRELQGLSKERPVHPTQDETQVQITPPTPIPAMQSLHASQPLQSDRLSPSTASTLTVQHRATQEQAAAVPPVRFLPPVVGPHPASVSRRHTRWDKLEDQILRHGYEVERLNFEDIAPRLPGRSARSCQVRYANYLYKR